MQLRAMRLRRRFLRKARSEARAYPPVVCKCLTTKSLRKKIKPTLAIQLHGYGLEPVYKLRGVLRRGILAVGKAARAEHPHVSSFGL